MAPPGDIRCSHVKDQGQGSTRYAWIGAGQCGGRLVKSFCDLGYPKVLAVDTSGHDLALLDLPENQKFLLGTGRGGHGVKSAEETARVLKQHRQDILHLARQTFAGQVDRIMICCGAGGNTGSGSVVELIETAKRYARYIGRKSPSRNVGVLMALPDAEELRSARVARTAHRVAATLYQMAAAGEISPLIMVDNQKVGRVPHGTTGPSVWSGINRTVATLFDAFNRLSSLSSPYTCFDPADYDRIMSSGGCLIMGTAQVDRLDDPLAISKAVEDSLRTTWFAGGENLSTAQATGCVVVGGRELMAHIKGLQDNIDYAFDILSDVTGQAISYRGIYEEETDGLRVYTIIGGLGVPKARLREVDVAPHSPPGPIDTTQKCQDDILFSAERFPVQRADGHRGWVKAFGAAIKTFLANDSRPGDGPELADAIDPYCRYRDRMMNQSAGVVLGTEVRGITAKENSRERGCHRARKGASIRFSQITRLELGIMGTVLLVLFLCRQPPQPGDADVRGDAGPTQLVAAASIENRGPNTQDSTTPNSQSESRDPAIPGRDQGPQSMSPRPPTATAPAAASHNSTAEPPLPPPPQRKPLGLVDARRCPGLNYNDVLYGVVTVRWVWDGAKFAAHKVVVVREKSGVISTWRFTDRDDVVVTEIP